MSNVFRILRTTVIKISLFFILLKKRKTVYRIYFVTRCISDPHFVLFYACDLRYFDVVLCPPPRAKSWRRKCGAALVKTLLVFYQHSAGTRSGCVNGPLHMLQRFVDNTAAPCKNG